MGEIIDIASSKEFQNQPFERLEASLGKIRLSGVDTGANRNPGLKYELLIEDISSDTDESEQFAYFGSPGEIRIAFEKAKQFAKEGLTAVQIIERL